MALVITISGDNRTNQTKYDSISIAQTAEDHLFSCELTIFDEDSDITIVSGSYLIANEITIVDGATTYFGGFVANVDTESLEDGSRNLHLQCQGYGILLGAVPFQPIGFTDTPYSDAEIIDSLFDNATDNHGMPAINSHEAGGAPAGYVAELDAAMNIYFGSQTLLECMEQLCTRTGGQFYVDNERFLHYNNTGGADVDFDLSDVPNQVTSFSYFDATLKNVDASKIVNRVRVLGKAGYPTVVNDAASQATYGIHGAILSNDTLETEEMRQEAGEAYLDGNKDPIVEYSLKTYKAGAEAGLTVDYKNDILGVNANFPIKELHITWENDEPVYELLLSSLGSGWMPTWVKGDYYPPPSERPDPFTQEDGVILFGQPPNITRHSGNPYWTATSGHIAQLVGGLHPVAGPWTGSVAYVFSKGVTNRVTHPVFNLWDATPEPTGWTKYSTPTTTKETDIVRYDTNSLKIVANAVADTEGWYTDVTGLTASQTYTIAMWVYCTAGTGRFFVSDGGGAANIVTSSTVSRLYRWERLSVQKVCPASNSIRVWCANGSVGNHTIIYDGVGAYQTGYDPLHVDGSLGDGYSWTGTAHASVSARASSYLNLTPLVGMISGMSVLSFRTVVQANYDADATWPNAGLNYVFYAYKDANEQISLVFDASDNKFKLYINTGWAGTTDAQTFKAKDWLDIICTIDFTNDEYKIFINGQLEAIDDTSLTAPELTSWNLSYSTSQSNFAYAEYAVFSTVLLDMDVYNLHQHSPLIDTNAKSTPPILLTSQSEDRMEVTGEEIAVYDGGVKATWLDKDGLTMQEGDAMANGVKWLDSSGVRRGMIWTEDTGGGDSYGSFESLQPAAADDFSWINLAAVSYGSVKTKILLKSKSSGALGQIYFYPELTAMLCKMLTTSFVMIGENTSITPDVAGWGYCGTSALYWKEINYKDAYDRGCLVDLGATLERVDKAAEWLTALESIRAIGVSDIDSPKTGKKQLDYTSFPVLCFDEGEYAKEDIYSDPERDEKGIITKEKVLLHKKGDKIGADGVNIGALMSLMLDAIKELSAKNVELEAIAAGQEATITEQGIAIADLLKRVEKLERPNE